MSGALSPTQWLTAEQIDALLYHVRREARWLRTHRARTNALIVEILVLAGLRRAELCGLRLRDLPAAHGKQALYVHMGKGGKSRTVWISDGLRASIERYSEQYRAGAGPDDPLLVGKTGAALSARTVWAKISAIGVEMGYDGPRGQAKQAGQRNCLYPHRLRHSAAVLHYQAGGNLKATQEMLGHANLATTQIYLHTSDEEASRIAEGMDR